MTIQLVTFLYLQFEIKTYILYSSSTIPLCDILFFFEYF